MRKRNEEKGARGKWKKKEKQKQFGEESEKRRKKKRFQRKKRFFPRKIVLNLFLSSLFSSPSRRCCFSSLLFFFLPNNGVVLFCIHFSSNFYNFFLNLFSFFWNIFFLTCSNTCKSVIHPLFQKKKIQKKEKQVIRKVFSDCNFPKKENFSKFFTSHPNLSLTKGAMRSVPAVPIALPEKAIPAKNRIRNILCEFFLVFLVSLFFFFLWVKVKLKKNIYKNIFLFEYLLYICFDLLFNFYIFLEIFF